MKRPIFEELDFQTTPLGDLILRRRTLPDLDDLLVHEIILGDAYLMTSLFTAVERELSRLGMAAAAAQFPNQALDIVVGGLGLGYTAKAALDHPATSRLSIIDYLKPVIDWHKRRLVPLGEVLTQDPRCRFVHADFFQWACRPKDDSTPLNPEAKHHAVLLDIDHSPANLLHQQHREFYSSAGLRRFEQKLHPGGIFGLWSDDPPAAEFMSALDDVFAHCESHVVKFENPHTGGHSESTVYLATRRA
ncbi:MAG: spermidine synthase [Verrucomicrobiales bacterium]